MNGRGRRLQAVAAALLLISGATRSSGQTTAPGGRGRRWPTVAALNFRNLKSAGAGDWLGPVAAHVVADMLRNAPEVPLSLADFYDVRDTLGKHGLGKADFSAAAAACKAGRLLRVERVVTGTFAAGEEDVALTLRVLDVGSGLLVHSDEVKVKRSEMPRLDYLLPEAVLRSYDKKVLLVEGRATVADAPPSERIVLPAAARARLRRLVFPDAKVWETFCRGLTAPSPKEEIRWYRRTLKLDPDCARAHNNLGKALYFDHRVKEAKPHFAHAIRLENDYADPYYNMGLVISEEGHPEAAIRHYRRAIELKPGFPEAYNNLAILLDRQGLRHRAEARSGHLKPEAARRRRAQAEKLTRRAVEYFRLAIKGKPDYAYAHNNLAALLTRQSFEADAEAARLAAEGKTDLAAARGKQARAAAGRAREHFSEAVRIKPDFPDVHFNLGLLFSRQGKTDEAVAAWRKALDLKPDLVEAHQRLGQALLAKGNPAEAVKHFTKAAELRPGSARAQSNVAYALFLQGRYKLSARHYRQALALKGDYLPAVRNLAWLLAACRDADLRDGTEAMKLARQACKLTNETDAQCLDVLAAACAEAGRFDEAVRTLQRAIALPTQAEQVKQLRSRLALYRAGKPFRLSQEE